jgi:hypothetical protein
VFQALTSMFVYGPCQVVSLYQFEISDFFFNVVHIIPQFVSANEQSINFVQTRAGVSFVTEETVS